MIDLAGLDLWPADDLGDAAEVRGGRRRTQAVAVDTRAPAPDELEPAPPSGLERTA